MHRRPRDRSRAARRAAAVAGGFRVDTGEADEVRRYVFLRLCPGIGEVAVRDARPGVLSKLCGTPETLSVALPQGLTAGQTGFVMRREGLMPGGPALADAYDVKISIGGPVTAVSIIDGDGQPAARGRVVRHDSVFIYDRIRTEPAHQRRGLGSAVLRVLETAAWNGRDVQTLIATVDGRSLYLILGWRVESPYSTARVV